MSPRSRATPGILISILALLALGSETVSVPDVPSSPPGLPEPLREYDIQNAVVLAVALFEPEGITVAGTGFIVHPLGLVLTNGHLASGRARVNDRVVEGSRVSFRVWLRAGTPQERALPAFRVAITQHDDHDLALLQLPVEHGPYPYLRFATISESDVGKVVRALGFPMSSPLVAVSGRRPALQSLSGLLQKIHREQNGKPILLEHSAPIIPGFSGGPLLNEFSQVIGVNSWAIKDTDRRLAIPAEVASEWVASQGFSWTPASAETDTRRLSDLLDWMNVAPVTEAPHKRWCVTTQNFLLPAIHANAEATLLISRNYFLKTLPQITRITDEGETLWTKPLAMDPSSDPVLVRNAGVAFIARDRLFLYNNDGEQQWEVSLPAVPGDAKAVEYRWLPPVVLADSLIVVGGDAPEVVAFTSSGEVAWRVAVGPASAILPVHEGIAVFRKPTGFIGSPSEIILINRDGAEMGRVSAASLSNAPLAQFVLPAVSEPAGDLYVRVAHSVFARIANDGTSRWFRSDFEKWQGGQLGSAEAPTRMALIGPGGNSIYLLNKLHGATLALLPAGASASWVSAGWLSDKTLVAVRLLRTDHGPVALLTVWHEKEGKWQPSAEWRAGPGPGIAIPAFRAVTTTRGDRIYAVAHDAGDIRACALVPPPP
ncbi:MAG: trypsin-like peptidase domain-containing protein [bacterium JZ-2024 1]